MEPSRFDDFTKALATATSRRQALKTIAATTLGGILGLSGIGTAFAKCKNAGHACGTNKQCCSGHCCNGTCSDCPCGQVKLCNGSCAKPCTSDADCPGCLGCAFAYPSGGNYCVNSVFDGACETTCTCPSGYICNGDAVACQGLC